MLDGLAALRITAPRETNTSSESDDDDKSLFVRLRIPVNLTTGPLFGVLVLLAVTAIGRQEVKDGTVGANNINPLDIMAFALTIGYVSSAIDATGLIRYLNFKILQRYARAGHRLFILLYALFFVMGCFFGNDPVIQMGMLMLTYMTKVAVNIAHPRAWIHTQFAVSNIASAIFVSSNTTNVIIAQAFRVSFAAYTANMIVPVLAAAVLMAPFLLYIVFAHEDLIPYRINLHELPEGEENRAPIPPSIPYKDYEGALFDGNDERDGAFRLSQVLNPALDKASATVGVSIMFTTLIVLMALTAANLHDVPVFWATLPAAFVMLCWDVMFGWIFRHHTRTVVRSHLQASGTGRRISDASDSTEPQATGRVESSPPIYTENSCVLPATMDDCIPASATLEDGIEAITGNSAVLKGVRTYLCTGKAACGKAALEGQDGPSEEPSSLRQAVSSDESDGHDEFVDEQSTESEVRIDEAAADILPHGSDKISFSEQPQVGRTEERGDAAQSQTSGSISELPPVDTAASKEAEDKNARLSTKQQRRTLMSLLSELWEWLQDSFPRVTLVVAHLPFSLILFVLPTFILVQALVSTGWMTAFARGWSSWTNKTGTAGAIAGMGFLSVTLSNVSLSSCQTEPGSFAMADMECC